MARRSADTRLSRAFPAPPPDSSRSRRRRWQWSRSPASAGGLRFSTGAYLLWLSRFRGSRGRGRS